VGEHKAAGKIPCQSVQVFLKKIDSGETDMNLCGSLPNHENYNVYDETPPQGLSEARRAGSFFEFLVSDPQRERPSGVAAFIVHGGVLKKIPYYTRIVRFSGEILN